MAKGKRGRGQLGTREDEPHALKRRWMNSVTALSDAIFNT
jgi:hypothetical protein